VSPITYISECFCRYLGS